MSETKFLDGLFADKPHDKAPDFVICKLSIQATKMCQALKAMSDAGELSEKGYLNLQVKRSKDGKYYASVDTWKPDASKASAPQAEPAQDDPFGDSIPF